MMPDFVDSEWFVMEEDNWHLKEGAPPEIVEEFNKWMEENKIDKDNPDILIKG